MNEQYRKLAADLSKECIVTKALARFLEQVIQTIHEEEIEPLKREIASLREANATWVALYGPVPPAEPEGEPSAILKPLEPMLPGETRSEYLDRVG